MKTLEITDANFREIVLQSTKTVLVDFTAEWCGPCKIMKPVISLLAEELSEVAVIVKLDVDVNPLTTAEFGVRSMPTFLVFNKGKLVDRVIGAVPKSVLESKILAASKAWS